jgi:hypothetical protein
LSCRDAGRRRKYYDMALGEATHFTAANVKKFLSASAAVLSGLRPPKLPSEDSNDSEDMGC